MSNYNAHGLAATLKQRAKDTEDVAKSLLELGGHLEVDEASGTYDDYWAQHAEDYLTHWATSLEVAAQNLRYLAGRYTLTGMHRVEAEQRGESS